MAGTYKTAAYFSLYHTSHHAFSCFFRPYRPSVVKGHYYRYHLWSVIGNTSRRGYVFPLAYVIFTLNNALDKWHLSKA